MRHASPVGVTSTGAGGWRRAQALLAAAAAAAAGSWGCAMLGGGAALQWGAAGIGAVAAGWFGWRAARPRPARLQWDGSDWSVDGVSGSVELTLDLGGWLLLRFRPGDDGAGGVRWLPLARHEAAADWHGLRVALHARAVTTP